MGREGRELRGIAVSSRLRAFFGNAPIKLIAVILFAILVPSVLVTALGLVAVFQVDAFVRNHFSEPVRARVVELRDELMGSWEERLDLYEQYLQDAPQRFQHLGELRDRDPWVLDVLVSNESGLVRVPELPPLRLWSADLDHQLKHLYALELAASHQKALAESLRLLAESREDAVLVEALLAAARLSSRVGDDAEGERHLQRALDRYGHTQDSTGVVRAVPILWRLLEIRRAGGQVARAEDTARELLGALDRYQDLLDPEVETFYREKIATLGDMPPVEKNRPGAFRWSSTALLSIEPLLPQPGRGKRQSAHIPPDLDIVTFASSASGLRVHLLLDRSQLLEEAKIVGREKGLSEEGLSFGLVKGRPMVGVSDGDSPRDDIFSSLLPAPLGAFRLAYVPPAGDLPQGFRAFKAISAAAKDPEFAYYKLKANAYKFSWALILFSMPFVWLLFPFNRRFKMYDHAIYVTYSIAFMSLLFSLSMLLSALHVTAGLVTTALLLYAAWHMYRQMKDAYSLSRFGAMWRLPLLYMFACLALALFFTMLVMMG